MKLILDIPYPLLSTFEPYSDAEHILLNMVKNEEYSKHFLNNKKKERWLGYLADAALPDITPDYIIDCVYKFEPDYVLSPFSSASSSNIVAVERFKSLIEKKGFKVKLIARWAGAMWELPILKNMVDLIGIAHVFFRDKINQEFETSKCHFFGYKYKDEALRLNPVSMNTSVPIRAAAIGISLRNRSRRPKGLNDFNPNQRLIYKEQIDLAIDNIKYIKEE